jgi:hypothetical protein
LSKGADADVADEVTVHAEHDHAVVVLVGDGDVTVASHEAQPEWRTQLTVAAAVRPDATKQSAVTAVEHSDTVRAPL